MKDRLTTGLLGMFRPDGTPGAGPSSAGSASAPPEGQPLQLHMQQQLLLQQHKAAAAVGGAVPPVPAWARHEAPPAPSGSGTSDPAMRRPQWVDVDITKVPATSVQCHELHGSCGILPAHNAANVRLNNT